MTRHLLVSWAKESDTSSCPLWGLDDSHPPTSWTGILILEFYYFLLIYFVFFWKTRGSNSSSISLIIMRVLIKLQWQTEMEYTKLLQNNLAIMRGCVRWTVWYTWSHDTHCSDLDLRTADILFVDVISKCSTLATETRSQALD